MDLGEMSDRMGWAKGDLTDKDGLCRWRFGARRHGGGSEHVECGLILDRG